MSGVVATGAPVSEVSSLATAAATAAPATDTNISHTGDHEFADALGKETDVRDTKSPTSLPSTKSKGSSSSTSTTYSASVAATIATIAAAAPVGARVAALAPGAVEPATTAPGGAGGPSPTGPIITTATPTTLLTRGDPTTLGAARPADPTGATSSVGRDTGAMGSTDASTSSRARIGVSPAKVMAMLAILDDSSLGSKPAPSPRTGAAATSSSDTSTGAGATAPGAARVPSPTGSSTSTPTPTALLTRDELSALAAASPSDSAAGSSEGARDTGASHATLDVSALLAVAKTPLSMSGVTSALTTDAVDSSAASLSATNAVTLTEILSTPGALPSHQGPERTPVLSASVAASLSTLGTSATATPTATVTFEGSMANAAIEATTAHDTRRSSTSNKLASVDNVAGASSNAIARGVATPASTTSIEATVANVVDLDGLHDAITRPIANGDGNYSVEVSMHPAELGHVQAVMALEHNALAVVLTPSTQAGHDALTTQLNALKNELAKDGLAVNVTLRDPSNGSSGQHAPTPRSVAASSEPLVRERSLATSSDLAGQIHVVL